MHKSISSSAVKKRTGVTRILYTFLHSFNGFKWLIKNEAAFQQELMLFVPLTGIACYLDISALQTVAVIVSMLFVLFAEMVNTAIEAVVDRVGLDFHRLSGVAKDIGSAWYFSVW
ncbi:diacylglycerol kinase [Vibrio mytili]|uniref:diacylglycerol kinase n=1 Tax=Vibrio mytili TaxID=50718 RepID=UPI000A7BAD49|nr:diacylglycerol kinase [Vibrio mytili]